MPDFDPFVNLTDFDLATETHSALLDLFALLEQHRPEWWTIGLRMDLGDAIECAGELTVRMDIEQKEAA